MIICPKTKHELTHQEDYLYCAESGYKALIRDGALFFNPEIDEGHQDYHALGLDNLFKAEDEHFWFKNRKNMIRTVFEKYVSKSEKVIEIGAGTGNVSRMLLQAGYDVAVGEIHSSGIEYARSYGIQERYQFDLLQAPFKEHFDVVGMFDVLEHIEDDQLALENVYQMLKPNGKIIITVPAHMWLWCREDAIAYHKRRYTVKGLKNILSQNGFDVLEAKSIFVSILPLLYLRTILHKDDGSKPTHDELASEIIINKHINRILDAITGLENRLLKNITLHIGGSIILVGRKRL